MAEEDIVARLRVAGGGEWSSSLRGARSDVEGLRGAADQVSRSKFGGFLDKSTGAVGGLAKAAGGATAGLAGLALSGIGAAAKAGIGFNKQLDTSRVRFSLFAKNQGEVNQLLDQAQNAAGGTLFSLAELSDVAANLGQSGVQFQNIETGMKGIANAATAAGGGSERLERISDIMGKMAAGGKLSAEMVNRLRDAGLNVGGVLQKEFKLSADEVANIGKKGIDARKAYDVLTKYFTSGEMGKAAERAANTTSGQFHNIVGALRRNIAQGMTPIWEELGTTVFPKVRAVIKQQGPNIQSAIRNVFAGAMGRDVDKSVKGASSGVATAANNVGKALRTGIGAAIQYGKRLLQAFKPAEPFFKNVLVPLFKGVGRALIDTLGGALKLLVPTIRIVATVFGFLGKILAPFKGIIETIGYVIGTYLTGVITGGFIKGIMSAVERIPMLGSVLRALGAPIMAFANWLMGLPGKVWLIINAVSRLAGPVIGALISAFNSIKGAIGAAASFVSARVNDIVGFVTGIAGRIAGAASSAFNSVKRGITDAANWARNMVNQIVGFVTGIGGRIGGAASTAFNAVKRGITDAANWVRQMVDQVVGFVKSIPGRIGNVFEDLASKANPLNWLGTGGIVAAQAGLTTGRGTTALVGERGPELARLPAGTRITPLPPPALSPSQFMRGEGGPVVAQVFLERRMIAEAMASYAAEQQAAR